MGPAAARVQDCIVSVSVGLPPAGVRPPGGGGAHQGGKAW